MAKSRKNAAASDIPLMPQVGDKVTKPRSESILDVALQLNPGLLHLKADEVHR